MPKNEKENKFFAFLKIVLQVIARIIISILKGIWNFLVFMNSLDRGWDNNTFPEEEDKGGLLKTRSSNIKLILSLASVAINADGKVQQKELEYVEKRFIKDYNAKTAKLWMAVLREELEIEHDIKKLCRKAEYRFDRATKIQLLYFLCGIVTRDGMLDDKEFQVLKQIGMRIKLPFQTLKSVLALFDYITEADAKSRQERKTEKKRSPKWFVDRAYVILEIMEDATDKEVKKAFRRLAVIHHPDKVSHMGESFQQAANKKFKELLDAYELIKEERGIV